MTFHLLAFLSNILQCNTYCNTSESFWKEEIRLFVLFPLYPSLCFLYCYMHGGIGDAASNLWVREWVLWLVASPPTGGNVHSLVAMSTQWWQCSPTRTSLHLFSLSAHPPTQPPNPLLMCTFQWKNIIPRSLITYTKKEMANTTSKRLRSIFLNIFFTNILPFM